MSTHFNPNQFFAKMSLLLLYWRLFSVNKTLRISVWTIGVVQTGWFISCWLARWFTCVPVHHIWDLTGDRSGCRERGPYVAASESINTLIDFVMVGLAIWMIQQLKVKTGVKWKLSILFVIGSLSGVVGVVKIVEAYSTACEFRIPHLQSTSDIIPSPSASLYNCILPAWCRRQTLCVADEVVHRRQRLFSCLGCGSDGHQHYLLLRAGLQTCLQRHQLRQDPINDSCIAAWVEAKISSWLDSCYTSGVF